MPQTEKNRTPSAPPAAVLGTMTFGPQVDNAGAKAIVDVFMESGFSEIDTAHTYGDGKTEEILGEILAARDRRSFRVATKAHPSVRGDLKPESVRYQLETSLRRLKLKRAEILYLHQPDLSTPVETTLEACDELHRHGDFEELGLSNYAAWQVADIHHICARRGWVLPTVYQGMYNALTRDVERELFPCLRSFGIRFYVYNPLAGGLLSGRYRSVSELPDDGRFSVYPFYRSRYWNERYFDAVQAIRGACERAGLPAAQAAISWLLHHSVLSGEARDAVVLGSSSTKHAAANLAAWRAGPLPGAVVAAIDEAWEIARPVCPKYFRP